MSDPVIRRVRRSIDEAQNRGGMQAGMAKVTIDASDATRLCLLAERLLTVKSLHQKPAVPEGFEVLRRPDGIMVTRMSDGGCAFYEKDSRLVTQVMSYHFLDTLLYTHPQPAQQGSVTAEVMAALESVRKRIEDSHTAMAPSAKIAVQRVFEAIRLEMESRTPMFSGAAPQPPQEGE